jgi:hypothetical protein
MMIRILPYDFDGIVFRNTNLLRDKNSSEKKPVMNRAKNLQMICSLSQSRKNAQIHPTMTKARIPARAKPILRSIPHWNYSQYPDRMTIQWLKRQKIQDVKKWIPRLGKFQFPFLFQFQIFKDMLYLLFVIILPVPGTA